MAARTFRRVISNHLLFYEFPVIRRPHHVYRLYSSSPKISGHKFRLGNLSVIALGIGGGALVGAGLSWKKFQEVKPPVLNNALERGSIVLKELPDVRIARKVSAYSVVVLYYIYIHTS